MNHISSETTTWQMVRNSEIGTQGGDRGSAMRANSSEDAAWLGRQAVREVDQAAVCGACGKRQTWLTSAPWEVQANPHQLFFSQPVKIAHLTPK